MRASIPVTRSCSALARDSPDVTCCARSWSSQSAGSEACCSSSPIRRCSVPRSVTSRTDNFGIQFTGTITVAVAGTYSFYTTSDDGSDLRVDSTTVVNNDGAHASQERQGSIALTAGSHSLRVRFFDPSFLGSSWMTSGMLLYNDANDFFGNADVRNTNPSQEGAVADYAVVGYTRFGGSLGVGRDVSLSTQLWLNYRLETINSTVPLQASHRRGFDIEPIDYDIVPAKK